MNSSSWQKLVEEFHRAMAQPVGTTPLLRDIDLRAQLIEEEVGELVTALFEDNLVEAIDASCDLIYVVLGTMVAAGVDLDPFFREVHRTNMAKASGPVRPDGKRLKPAGWTPPRIAEMLAEMKARGGK